jgi:hypothetical protein
MYTPAAGLPGYSRIWIYQSDRELTEAEVSGISQLTREFSESWTAHNNSLKAGFEIRYNRFLMLMVDEKSAGASGCSIDKSVHFIKSLEEKYGLSFFDRMKFAYQQKNKVEVASKADFAKMISEGIIDDNTLVYNNLIGTKDELADAWEIPFGISWHKQLI